MYHYKIHLLFIGYLLCLVACSPNNSNSNDLYEKTIFTDDASKPKIKEGDVVTFYYCLKNGSTVIMSSDQVLEAAVITIPNDTLMDNFQRPLTWLGLGDSCIVHINMEDASNELATYKEHFVAGDKATFIYKVLKIN